MCISDVRGEVPALEGGGVGGKEHTQAEIAKHNTPEDCWLIVNGKAYDVTSWVPSHPGGPLIYARAGGDCTQMFNSYHPLKVRAMLAKYEVGSVKVAPGEPPLVEYVEDLQKGQFYHTLKARVETFFNKSKIDPRVSQTMYVKTAVILAVLYACYYMAFWHYTSLPAAMCWAAAWGLVLSGVGVSIQHDGNHGAYGTSPTFSWIMGLTLDFVAGSSSFMWKQQHVVGHHPYTNVDGLDPDVRGHGVRRVAPGQQHLWFFIYQQVYLAALYGLLTIKGILWDDFETYYKGTVGSIALCKMTAGEKAVFWGGKAFYALHMIALPLAYGPHSFARFWGLWLFGQALCGLFLALMFSVAHMVPGAAFPVLDVKSGKVPVGWAESQLLSTADFAPDSFFWTHVSGGLNYQVVHHLFPGVCHCHYPKIAPILAKTAEEFGLEYKVYPTFMSATVAHFKHLTDMGRP